MNGTLSIAVDDGQTQFLPGAKVAGNASWSFDRIPKSLSLRLFWHTSGRGAQDVGLAGSIDVQEPAAAGSTDFSFTLPESPCSFSGKLITLKWSLELVASPSNLVARQDICVSHTGCEIFLAALPESEPGDDDGPDTAL